MGARGMDVLLGRVDAGEVDAGLDKAQPVRALAAVEAQHAPAALGFEQGHEFGERVFRGKCHTPIQ